MLNIDSRTVYDDEINEFRHNLRRILAKEVQPNIPKYEQDGIVPRELWKVIGEAGLLCPTVPPQYGGLGLDFRYNAVIDEEVSYLGVALGISLQSDIVACYLLHYGTEDQKQYWLPKMISGDAISAIAMTEPGTGSDLQGIKTTAQRDGDHFIINGQKTFITNGQTCDLVIVAARTSAEGGANGISLIIVETDRPGFQRGRNLDKIGQHEADTSEMFFDDVRVPVTNLLGEEGRGFHYLVSQLAQERLSVAIAAQANAQRGFDITVDYVKQRQAFGTRIIDFQNTSFALAEMKAKLQVGWTHIDWALARHIRGELTAVEASAAKLWHTETQWQIMDGCLQLYGGHGYMNEMEIARLWRNARVTRMYAGTSEIMKLVVGRSL